jgi:hypothetical protein
VGRGDAHADREGGVERHKRASMPARMHARPPGHPACPPHRPDWTAPLPLAHSSQTRAGRLPASGSQMAIR